jgi:hypothetical protein
MVKSTRYLRYINALEKPQNMIRNLSDMSHSKRCELSKIETELDEIRLRLDKVMYIGSPLQDETVEDLREIYGKICEALDKF